MTTRDVLAALISLALAAMITPARSNEDTTSLEVEKAVLHQLDEIQRAAEALDPDEVFRFVLENDKGALVQDGQLHLTRQEALDSTKRGFSGLQKVQYRFDRQHVTQLSPTVAIAVGEGSSTATIDDGRTITTRFAQTVVFVLTHGEWKVTHSHRSVPKRR